MSPREKGQRCLIENKARQHGNSLDKRVGWKLKGVWICGSILFTRKGGEGGEKGGGEGEKENNKDGNSWEQRLLPEDHESP